MLFGIYHNYTKFLDVIAWKDHVLGIYHGNTMVLGYIMQYYHVISIQHHGKPCYLAFILEMFCCFHMYCGKTIYNGNTKFFGYV